MQGSFAQRKVLTIEQMVQFAPSTATEIPHSRLSDRYQPYPTVKFAEYLQKLGWYPTQAVEVAVRTADNKGFQKHMVRFEHPDTMLSVSQEFLQLLLINSTDGRCAYQMSLGIWRLICSNGTIVGDEFCHSPRIRHLGYDFQDVIDVSHQVLDQAPLISENISTMKQIELKPVEREAFAEAAVELILPPDENPGKRLNIKEVLQPRRRQDALSENTLWTTFNTIQENATKGYLNVYTPPSGNDNGSIRKMRETRNIDRNVHLNKALWVLAETMKKLKLGVDATIQ